MKKLLHTEMHIHKLFSSMLQWLAEILQTDLDVIIIIFSISTFK